jgi:hypothetical protein
MDDMNQTAEDIADDMERYAYEYRGNFMHVSKTEIEGMLLRFARRVRQLSREGLR